MAAFFMMECEERPFDRVVAPTSWRNSTTLSIRILSQLPLVKVNHYFLGFKSKEIVILDSRAIYTLRWQIEATPGQTRNQRRAVVLHHVGQRRALTPGFDRLTQNNTTNNQYQALEEHLLSQVTKATFKGGKAGRKENAFLSQWQCTVCLSFFIQIFLFPFLPHIYSWYLVRIVDNRHFLPELQIWAGIAPHSSQSLHCKYIIHDHLTNLGWRM